MEAQTIICQNCQTPNPAKNLYCQSCGKPLAQAASPPSVPPATDQPPEPAPQEPPAEEEVSLPQTPVYPTPVQPPVQMQGQEPQPQGSPQTSPPQQAYRPQDLPPQQPAYYPPSPPPPSPGPAAPSLESLGAWKDGWADLIAGEGTKAGDVEGAFVEDIKARNIAMAMVEKVDLTSKLNKKNYLVVRSSSGTVAVQINPSGNDLSLSWSLYTKHQPNWRMLAILGAIAFAVSFLNALGTYNFGIFFLNWIFGMFGWLMPVAVLALIAGYVWKGSLWYFFLEDPGDIARGELAELTLAVHQSLQTAVEKAGLDAGALRQKPAFRVGNSFQEF